MTLFILEIKTHKQRELCIRYRRCTSSQRPVPITKNQSFRGLFRILCSYNIDIYMSLTKQVWVRHLRIPLPFGPGVKYPFHSPFPLNLFFICLFMPSKWKSLPRIPSRTDPRRTCAPHPYNLVWRINLFWQEFMSCCRGDSDHSSSFKIASFYIGSYAI